MGLGGRCMGCSASSNTGNPHAFSYLARARESMASTVPPLSNCGAGEPTAVSMDGHPIMPVSEAVDMLEGVVAKMSEARVARFDPQLPTSASRAAAAPLALSPCPPHHAQLPHRSPTPRLSRPGRDPCQVAEHVQPDAQHPAG